MSEDKTEEVSASRRPDRKEGSLRVAVIWLPGLDASANTALDSVARRIAYALDRRAHTAEARFRVDERIEEIDRGKAGKSRRATIVRADGEAEVPVVDVFELDYAESLLRPHLEATAFCRWFEASWVVIYSLILALGIYFRRRRAKLLIERLQLVVGAICLLVLVCYVWLLFIAVVVAIDTLFDWKLASYLIPAGFAETTSKILGGLLVLVLGASATVPALRARIDRVGAIMISAFAYLRVGRQRHALTGRLADLIEHIAEQGATYRRVDIVANSFGSLIALDAMFPIGDTAEPRLKIVKYLVTIGCPFDAVRAIWPEYGRGRGALDSAPTGWLNIYSPLDVFGSNFRDDNVNGRATVAIAESSGHEQYLPTNHLFSTGQGQSSLKLPDVLFLQGFRAHGRYWGDQEEAETTCFNAMVSQLFDGDPVLA